jgi:hypothetical protein
MGAKRWGPFRTNGALGWYPSAPLVRLTLASYSYSYSASGQSVRAKTQRVHAPDTNRLVLGGCHNPCGVDIILRACTQGSPAFGGTTLGL